MELLARDQQESNAHGSSGRTTAVPGVIFGYTRQMSPSDWYRVKDNPRQRDTARHAKRADHLRKPHPVHARVQAAQLPDGTLVKLDGHTRSFLWSNGEVEPPRLLYVDVYYCADMEGAGDLYATFDNRAAVETVADEIFGSVRALGIEWSSDLFKQNRFVAAMRYAYEMLFGAPYAYAASPNQLLNFWLPELKLLDTVGATRQRFPTAIVVGALLTLRHHGPKALPFFDLYNKGMGSKQDGKMDAVQALDERLKNRKAVQTLSGRGNVYALAAQVVSAYSAWTRNQVYNTASGGIKGLSGQNWIDWLKATKSR